MEKEKNNNIILSTNNINRGYNVVGVVTAVVDSGSNPERLLGPIDILEQRINDLNEQLQKKAKEMGCDAVLWVTYKSLDANGHFIMASGTGVKFKEGGMFDY